MDWKDILKIIVTPEVVGLLSTIILAKLVRSKIISEQDIATAKKMMTENAATATEIATKVKMTVPEVAKVMAAADVKSDDPLKNKVQRGIRAALRGWLRF